MKYIIKIKDGMPFEHPIAIENFKLAFPDVDLNNLDPEWVEFCRVLPSPNKYQTPDSSTYEWVDGKIYDVWTYFEVSEEKKREVEALEDRIASTFNMLNSGSTPNVIG